MQRALITARTWTRLRHNSSAAFGLIVVSLALIAGIVGPWLTGSPTDMGAQVFCPPGPECPFGTDDLGRDMLARVANGARVEPHDALTNDARAL